MGQNFQGINGNFSGKIGPTVGRISKGRTITSIYQPSVNNPRTQKQTTARARFTLVVKFLATLTGWAKIMCKGISRYGSTYNGLLAMNMEDGNTEIISGTYPNLELALDKVELCRGDLDLPYNPSAVVDSNVLNISWTDNTGAGDALATDVACIVAYNSAKEQPIYTTSGDTRMDCLASLTLPTSWSGDAVDVWFAMRRADGSMVSNSVYLGNISI